MGFLDRLRGGDPRMLAVVPDWFSLGVGAEVPTRAGRLGIVRSIAIYEITQPRDATAGDASRIAFVWLQPKSGGVEAVMVQQDVYAGDSEPVRVLSDLKARDAQAFRDLRGRLVPGDLVSGAGLEGEVEEVTLLNGAGRDAAECPSRGLLVMFFRSGKDVDFCVPVLFDTQGRSRLAFEAKVRRPRTGGH